MRLAYVSALIALAGLISGFVGFVFDPKVLIDGYEFVSGGSEACRPSDVDFSRVEVQEFFRQATAVSSRLIHDEYDLAPCYLEGQLVHHLNICRWTLRPDLLGTLDCGGHFQYLLLKH